MHTFLNWIKISLSILLIAALMPSVDIVHPLFALRISLVFGAIALAMPLFLRYVDLSVSYANIILFDLLASVALVFYTSVVEPGFYVQDIPAATRFAAATTLAHAYLVLGPVHLDLRRNLARLSQIVHSRTRPRPTLVDLIPLGLIKTDKQNTAGMVLSEN